MKFHQAWNGKPGNPYGFVNDFVYDNNFTHEKKDYFESIASGQEATDYCNYILGYQNTQVLFAYNEYCTSKGKEADIIRPVEALDDFEKNHPSPSAVPAGLFLHRKSYIFFVIRMWIMFGINLVIKKHKPRYCQQLHICCRRRHLGW